MRRSIVAPAAPATGADEQVRALVSQGSNLAPAPSGLEGQKVGSDWREAKGSAATLSQPVAADALAPTAFHAAPLKAPSEQRTGRRAPWVERARVAVSNFAGSGFRPAQGAAVVAAVSVVATAFAGVPGDALSFGLFAPFIFAGLAPHCLQEKHWAATRSAQAAFNTHALRESAFNEIRSAFHSKASAFDQRLALAAAPVLVDPELLVEAGMHALWRSHEEVLEAAEKDSSLQGAAATELWREKFQAQLKDTVVGKGQGLLAAEDVRLEAFNELAPQFFEAAAAWEENFSAIANITEAVRSGAVAPAQHALGKAIETVVTEVTGLSQKTVAAAERVVKADGAKLKAAGTLSAVIAFILWAFFGGLAEAATLLPFVAMAVLPGGPPARKLEYAPLNLQEFLKQVGVGDGLIAKQFLNDLSVIKPEPFDGRVSELTEVLNSLAQARSMKKGVVLVGNQGSGRMSIIKRLARQVHDGLYPMLDVKFVEIDVQRMASAGAQVATNYNDRPPLEKFLDDVLPKMGHHAIFVLRGERGVFTPSILSPLLRAMEHGNFRFVISMTPAMGAEMPRDFILRKYAKFVTVKEPDESEARSMLAAHKKRLQEKTKLKIHDEVLDLLPKLAQEFLRRINPQQIVETLEETVVARTPESQETSALVAMNANFVKMEQALSRLRSRPSNARRNTVIRLALSLNEHAKRLKAPIEPTVETSHLRIKMAELHNNKLIVNPNSFKKKMMEAIPKIGIVAQEPAVAAVRQSLTLAAAGLTGHSRPIASYLFLGPTGVGKTELARSIAHQLFADENALVRLDMSEYAEKHRVSSLIGPPPGYELASGGGELTNKVKARPFSVVLFDEFEKAHKDVHRLLLPLLDDGWLTDGLGEVVDFRRTVNVMTSNAFAEEIRTLFAKGLSKEQVKEALLPKLKEQFSPELIGRIGEIVFFKELNKSEILEIGRKLVEKELGAPLRAQGHVLNISDVSKEALELVGEQGGVDPQFGARPMRQALISRFGIPLAEAILAEADEEPPSRFKIGVKDGQIEIQSEPIEAPKDEDPLELPSGRLGSWLTHWFAANLDERVEPSAAGLRESYEKDVEGTLQPQQFGNFYLQHIPAGGDHIYELSAAHFDANQLDSGLSGESNAGGGIFGWLKELEGRGYARDELQGVRTWFAKQVRCGKDCERSKRGDGKLTVRWERNSFGDILTIVAPPLTDEEAIEAYETYKEHFSVTTKDAEESFAQKDRLASEGKRARALLFEIKRKLGAIKGAEFGAYWDQQSSSYWLALPRRAPPKAAPLPTLSGPKPEPKAPLVVTPAPIQAQAPAPPPPAEPEVADFDYQTLLIEIMEAAGRVDEPDAIIPRKPYSAKQLQADYAALERAIAGKRYEEASFILEKTDWREVRDAFNPLLIPVIDNSEELGLSRERFLGALWPWFPRYAPHRRLWLEAAAKEIKQAGDRSGLPLTWYTSRVPWDESERRYLRALVPEEFQDPFSRDDRAFDYEADLINFWREPSERFVEGILETGDSLVWRARMVRLAARLSAPRFELLREGLVKTVVERTKGRDPAEWESFLQLLEDRGSFLEGLDIKTKRKIRDKLKTLPPRVLEEVRRNKHRFAVGARVLANLGNFGEPHWIGKEVFEARFADHVTRTDPAALAAMSEPGQLANDLRWVRSQHIQNLYDLLQMKIKENPKQPLSALVRGRLPAKTEALLRLYHQYLRNRPELTRGIDVEFLARLSNTSMGDTIRERAQVRALRSAALPILFDVLTQAPDHAQAAMNLLLPYHDAFDPMWSRWDERPLAHYLPEMVYRMLLGVSTGISVILAVVGLFLSVIPALELVLASVVSAFFWIGPIFQVTTAWHAWQTRRAFYRFFERAPKEAITPKVMVRVTKDFNSNDSSQSDYLRPARRGFAELQRILHSRAIEFFVQENPGTRPH